MAKIHFLNVDEGDCSVVQHDNGKVTMIDICCGNIVEQQPSVFAFCNASANSIKGNFNMKAYPTNPVEYIKRRRMPSIFRYIQTHPDMDHMDGLKNLANTISIMNFWIQRIRRCRGLMSMAIVDAIRKRIGIAISVCAIVQIIQNL